MQFPGSTLGAALWASAAAHAAGAVLPGPAFPNYRDAGEVEAACDAGLAGAVARVLQFERVPASAAWLPAADRLYAYVEDVSGPIYVLTTVHPDKAIRDATEACELRWQDFNSTLGQNKKLYRAAMKLQPRDAIDREFLQRTVEDFVDAGVSLPPDQRKHAKALNDGIAALSQAFQKNIRDDNAPLAFTEAELKGVPETLWRGARQDAQGRYLITVDDATYGPLMQNAIDPGARERFWRADSAKGGQANLALLAQIGQLRGELGRLFGKASCADFKWLCSR